MEDIMKQNITEQRVAKDVVDSQDIQQPSFWEDKKPEEVQSKDKLQNNVVKSEVNYLKQRLAYLANAPVVDVIIRYDGRIGEIVGITPVGGQLTSQDLHGLLEKSVELLENAFEEKGKQEKENGS